jgi:hypothetical protein
LGSGAGLGILEKIKIFNPCWELILDSSLVQLVA